MIANPESIEEMYPRVPVEMLVSAVWQRRFAEYFIESGELEADPFEVATFTERPQKKCVSVSLFRRNANNRAPNEFPLNASSWKLKYWDGLQSMVREMAGLPEWKLRIHVEKDLWSEAAAEFSDNPQVELYGMKANSVGASPGTLWRFMTLADPSLELVLETDIDEPLGEKIDCVRTFEMDPWSSIGRLGEFISDRQYLVAPHESVVKNYPTMIASRVVSRPARFDFDLAAAMRGFMAYRRYMSATDRPWAYSDDEAPSVYNRPVGSFVDGWGSHWYGYCFDERFLKHVVYYHFADRGALHTWTDSLPPSRLDREGLFDQQYVRLRANVTVCPRSAVRLESLRLAPDALRIAFVLDEYRWIFDSLQSIMRQHPQTGYCGNLFFHNIDEPYFIDLIPKQLNLFNAAWHASQALEVGFNAGHSAALMLLANPRLTIRAFDACGLAYTKPCLAFLNSIFENRIALVEGYSQVTLKSDAEAGFDLVHIDADHTYEAVAADLANSLPKCADGAIVVMDDYEVPNDVARATLQRTDLVPTEAYTLHNSLPGSAHAIFHYRPAL